MFRYTDGREIMVPLSERQETSVVFAHVSFPPTFFFCEELSSTLVILYLQNKKLLPYSKSDVQAKIGR